MKNPETAAQVFAQHRVLLFSLAYRMLGSATDAEDIIQDAFLRWLQGAEQEIQSPRAYLSAVVIRLCIDQLRVLKARREIYIGPWLPEPVATAQYEEVAESAVLTESLSFAFLVLLEKLGPLERAVFLLRDVFDYDYAEIAAIVGKSEANCRQVFHRARQHLGQQRPRFTFSKEQQERRMEQFRLAATSGDMQGLLAMLTDDIVLTSDGGGKTRAALKSISGKDKVIRGLLGIFGKVPKRTHIGSEEINGQPAFVAYLDGQIIAVLALDFVEEHIQHLYLIVNPEKLHWLYRRLSTDPLCHPPAWDRHSPRS